jgi:hypothetical protein
MQIESSEEVKREMELEAFLFLMAGGVLTFTDWQEFTKEEKQSFINAGRKFRADIAAQTGMAAHGMEQALSVYSDVDGGEMRRDFNFTKATNAAAENVKDEYVAGR